MASHTRSRRLFKDEATRSSRSRSAGQHVKDVKGSTTSGSTANGSLRSKVSSNNSKDNRSSTTSDSAATDSLRKSSREVLTKRVSESIPGSRRSARLENQSPSPPSDKRKVEKPEGKRSKRTLRRSERIERNSTSNSSSSKKLDKTSSSMVRSSETKLVKKEKKLVDLDSKEEGQDKELDKKISVLSKKRKRMDARTYRASLRVRDKKAKSSDAIRVPKNDNASPQDTVDSRAHDSIETLEGRDECNEGKEEETKGKHFDGDCKEVAEGSSSESRKLAQLLRTDGGRKYTCSRTNHDVIETCDVKYDEGQTHPKYTGRLSKSSLVGITTKENVGGVIHREADSEEPRLNVHGLVREELGTLDSVKPASKDKSVAADPCLESGGILGASKNVKVIPVLDPSNSVTSLDKQLFIQSTSTTDGTISCLGTKSRNLGHCTVCSKHQRVQDSEYCELCSCMERTNEDSSMLHSKEGSKVVVIPGNTERDDIVAKCTQEIQNKGNSASEAGEQSARSEKHVTDNLLISSADITYVNFSMGEDRGRLEVSDSIGISRGQLPSSHLKDSSMEIKTDNRPNACVVCKLPGLLLCCDGRGCRRSYHLSCLDPPLQNVPPGVWLCISCVKKKIEFGVYSVSEGIESVWDVREEMQSCKQYLVKYKGLSHVHNRWIPEGQILLEAPALVSKFNRRHQKEKVTRFKQEWNEPHRLLQKRLLMPRKLADDFFRTLGNNTCYHEWFVKWKGLGYEHATWEFENSPFLCSSEAMVLIKDYETRHVESKNAHDPSRFDKALQIKANPFHKLSRLPDGCPPGLDNDHLNSVNRLLEFWHKSQNAVFIDDQERFVKSILFIMTILSHTCRPFLIISTITSLSFWETEFSRLAPSINVVVYNGNKEVRKMIQALEFYQDSGCTMFEVLISHPDAIIEDFETVECIGWEAIIVDECQSSRISKHLEQLKNLSTDFRLLLLSGPLKENLAEYLSLLSFLDSGGKENSVSNLKFDSTDMMGTLAILKERLLRYLAYERKPDSSKFAEYWVPIRLSDVQLEQYCATLISNCMTLRSCSKIDHVGALRDLLISTRKCCDHPYLVDELLQNLLTKDLPPVDMLNVGVNASGKLLLLDKVLQEMKNRGLRVLILFQSIGGAGRNSIGDILDDFLRQRFGADSYERVDSGLIMSKKLAALNKFNDKAKGRFAFLIENRACLPSIKLSSVDAVIIYDSDWNPLSDLRALQKISIESQFEQVVVFRLYTSCTVEEKVLIFAKQDMILDSNVQNINPCVSHSLLSWGALHLLSELDEFHQHDKPNKRSLNFTDTSFLDSVVMEVLTKLPNRAEVCSPRNSSLVIKAQPSGASYSRNIILIGERDGISSLDKDPQGFWSNLLEGRHYQWRYISEPSQRSRRKVQHIDGSIKFPEVEQDEGKKKRRKVVSNTVDPTSVQSWVREKRKETAEGEDAVLPENPASSSGTNWPSVISPRKAPAVPTSVLKERETSGVQVGVELQCTLSSPSVMTPVIRIQHISSMSDNASTGHGSQIFESEVREKLLNEQRSLHLLLKPELSSLCEALRLPEDVNDMAQKFLEYVINNHNVSRGPENILQAFKIALCWRAASFVKHKVDRMESLARAKKYLNFECDEELAESVYHKLQFLKRKFSRQTCALKNDKEPNSIKQPSVSGEDVAVEPLCQASSNLEAFSRHKIEKEELRESPGGHRYAEQLMPAGQGQVPVLGSPAKLQHIGSLKDELLKKRIYLINKICSRRMEELLTKQQLEISDFNRCKEEAALNLKKAHESNLKFIGTDMDSTVKNDSMRQLKLDFSQKMAGFEEHMNSQLRNLEVMQSVARNKEQQIKDHWLDAAKAGTLLDSFDNIPLSDSGFRMETLKVSVLGKGFDGLGNTSIATELPSMAKGPADYSESSVKSSDNSAVNPNGGMKEMPPMETDTLLSQPNSVNAAEPAKPTEAVVDLPKIVRPGETGYLPVEEETGKPKSMSGEKSFEPSSSVETLAALPLGETSKMPMRKETGIPACQSNSMNEAESVEPCGRTVEIPAAIPPGVMGDVPMERRTEPPASQCTRMNGVEPVVPGRRVEEISETVSPGESILPMETETRASPVDVVNSVSSNADAMLVDSETAGLIDQEQNRDADHSDGPCLIYSSLQSRAEIPSITRALTGLCENEASSNQGPSTSEHERPADSAGVVNCQGCSSSQQSAFPLLHSINTVPSQDGPFNHNTTVSNSSQSQLHLSTSMPSVGHVRGSRPACLQNEQHSNQTICSTRQIEASTQQPTVAAAVLGGQFNQRVLHSAVRPLQSNFNMPPERNHFGDLGSQSNQLVSQSAVHPMPSNLRISPERFHSGDLRSNSVQPDLGSRVLHPFPMVPSMLPQGLQAEPLKNELTRIRIHEDSIAKMHDDKKLRLKAECDQEIEKIRRKYDSLIQDAETEFLSYKRKLEMIYKKVLLNQVLAEEFRAKFTENTGGASAAFHGPRSSSLQQLTRTSHPQLAQSSVSTSPPIPVTTPATVSPAPATVPSLLGPARNRPPPYTVSSVSSGQVARQTSSVFPSNPVRPHFSPTLPTPANHQVASGRRAPAPHLHSFRPHASISAHRLHTSMMTSQQQTLTNLGSVASTLPQSAPLSHLHHSNISVNGTCQPGGLGTLPHSSGPSLSNISVGANIPNLSWMADIGQAFDSWLASNYPSAGSSLTQSAVDASRPAVTGVVYISDED